MNPPRLPLVYLHTNSPHLAYFPFTSSYFGDFPGAGQPGRAVPMGSRSVWGDRVPLWGVLEHEPWGAWTRGAF